MKKIILTSVILFYAAFLKTEAQVNVNVNIGAQPIWGPVGYNYVNYYYLPDLGVYYDVPGGVFVYFDFGRWNFGAALPARYGGYDLFHCYKVVINEHDPWMRNSYYHAHYASYRGRYQPVIRDSRYYAETRVYEHKHYDHDYTRYAGYDEHRGGKHGDRKYDNDEHYYRTTSSGHGHGKKGHGGKH